MMAWFEGLVSSGRIVDLLLVVVACEVLVLIALRRRTGAGIATGPLLVSLGAGVCLMLALRAALSEASWTWIVAFLALALVFHVGDLALRWRRGRSS